jgi:1,4-alpha-glucan branching enzyme
LVNSSRGFTISPIMKHKHNYDNAQNVGIQLEPVRFEFTHPTATRVSVAGTFNDWHPTAKSLQSSGDGHWLNETALPPGTYEYCLVVDGQWIADPLAIDYVPNPFGGRNSILVVKSSFARIPAPQRGKFTTEKRKQKQESLSLA